MHSIPSPPPPPPDSQMHARLLSVLEVTKELAAERSFDRLLDLIIKRACDALGCERSSLFLYDADRKELYTRRVTKLDKIQEIRLPADKGIVGVCFQQRQLVFIDDPYHDPRFDPSVDRSTGFRTRSILCVPLESWTDGRMLGVLQLLNKHEAAVSDWDRELLRAYAAHAAIAIERAILAAHYEQKTRLEVELNAAREIQAGFFPHELPQPPGYQLVAFHEPADATGGDYYDAIPLDDSNFGLVVADVSGHGLGPSLLMASMRAMLRAIVLRETQPELVLSELARAMQNDLCPDLAASPSRRFRFITVLYGTLDPREHVFWYADAGHGPLTLHYRAAEDEVRKLTGDPARGAPLGIHTDDYQLCEPVHLDPGDLLVLGTDGVVETRRGSELFGLPRFCELLKRNIDAPLPQMLETLVAASKGFHAGAASDDLTLMILRREE
jgi:sigma-B regulation protein RsbU (phosphoserine phosphatase)